MLAAGFRLVIFWLCFTGARCAGVAAGEAAVSLITVSPTAPSRPTATSSSSTSSHAMTSTSASAVPSPAQTTFSFNPISNMTTCTSGIITWTYNSSSANLLLSIMKVANPYQSGNLTRRQSTTGNLSATLAEINATLNSWTWSQVNVPQGWYQLQGTVAPLSAVSAAFFVSNGSDVSCLPMSSSSPVTGSSSSTASNSDTLDTGDIVGIALGALAGLGVLAVIMIYYLRRCHSRDKRRCHDTKENIGRWSSLKSNSSTIKSPLDSNAGDTSTAQSDTTVLVDENQTYFADTTSPAEEKVGPYHSSQQIIPSDSVHPPPSSYNPRMSIQSPFDQFSSGDAHCRRHSELNFEEQATRIRSSMEGSMYVRTGRMSLPALPRTPTSPKGQVEHPSSPVVKTFSYRGRDRYPLSPVATTFPHRERDEYPPYPVVPTSPHRGRDEVSSSPRAATSTSRSPSAARRAARKPVPRFDPSELRDPTGGLNDTQPAGTSDESSPSSHDIPALSPSISPANNSRMYYLIPDLPPPRTQ